MAHLYKGTSIMYRTVYKEVEVDVDLSDFDTDDLLEELESRDELLVDSSHGAKDLLNAIWLKRRMGHTDYETELDQLIYTGLGQIV